MTERELKRAVQVLNKSFREGAERRFDRTWNRIDAAGLLPRLWFNNERETYVVLTEAPGYYSWFEKLLKSQSRSR